MWDRIERWAERWYWLVLVLMGAVTQVFGLVAILRGVGLSVPSMVAGLVVIGLGLFGFSVQARNRDEDETPS